jgi:predicted kinase
MAATLIIFGGLPGTGKTAIAVELARQFAYVHLRIDSIEQAIRDSGVMDGDVRDAGYRVAYAVAEDNLRLGRSVIADCVNPLQITRDAWLAVADRAGAGAVEVEIVCSDSEQHRRRVETRVGDIAGLRLPSWQEVLDRDYDSWQREHIVIDTATQNLQESVRELRAALEK